MHPTRILPAVLPALVLAAASASLGGFAGALRAQDVLGPKGKSTVQLEWEKQETASYEILYEKVIASDVVKRVGDELEDILAEYKKLFPCKLEGKLKVQFLDNQNTFEQVGGDVRHPGFYSPANRTLVLKQREYYELIPTVYHEAFHQYLDHFVRQDGDSVPIPLWFNEGMAEYFEGMQRDEHTKAKKLNPQKIRTSKIRMVQSALRTRTHIPLEKLIAATPDEFYAHKEESLHYHQSFAVVFYFMETTKGRGPATFMRELQKSKDPEKALETLLGKERKKLAQVEAQWKAFTAKVDVTAKK